MLGSNTFADVRTLLRYLVVSGIAIALAWGVFVVRVGDRTLFGHTRALGEEDVGNAWTRLKGGVDERLEELNGVTAEERKKKQDAKARAKALAEKRAKKDPKKDSAKVAARTAPAPRGSAKASAKPAPTARTAAATAAARPAVSVAARPAVAVAADRPVARPTTKPAEPVGPPPADVARVARLKEAQTLARAMQKADAAAPPRTTKVDERLSGGASRVDALLAE